MRLPSGPLAIACALILALGLPDFGQTSARPGPAGISPLQAYLKASNTESEDRFGTAVAISGDTIVVGARGEDSATAVVNGDQRDNSMDNAGAAYVFVRSGTTWRQQAYLKASNPSNADGFGGAVAISGDTIVVGARGEDSAATGVNGDQRDNSKLDAGAVYVFVRTGTTWRQQAYLKASNTDGSDFFGTVVAISGDTIVVGAYGEDSAATGVNGDQTNNSLAFAGAAYIFVRTGTTWRQQAYLKASNTELGDSFGSSVTVSRDTVVVGASGEDSAATGVNGDQRDNSAPVAGAAYAFVRAGTTWRQQAYLKASDSRSYGSLGISAGAEGDRVVLGAAGAAYVFAQSDNAWSEQGRLQPSLRSEGDGLLVVAISGDTILIGDPDNQIIPIGPPGTRADCGAAATGRAYLFGFEEAAWRQQACLTGGNTDPEDRFGIAVAQFGATTVVTADLEASAATMVDGDQADNSAPGAGAAYAFFAPYRQWYLPLTRR